MSALPCSLYRYFDADGRLLYVGISINAVVRLSQHRDKPWFIDVASMKCEWHPTREDAEAAERRAIRDENPLHNVRHAVSRSALALTDADGDAEIDVEHAQEIARFIHRHPEHRFYDIEDAAEMMRVNPMLLEEMCVPPSTHWRFSRNDLLVLADRMSRGKAADFEPLVLGYRLAEPIGIGGGVGAPPLPDHPSSFGDVMRRPPRRFPPVATPIPSPRAAP